MRLRTGEPLSDNSRSQSSFFLYFRACFTQLEVNPLKYVTDYSVILCVCDFDGVGIDVSTGIVEQSILFRWTWTVFQDQRTNRWCHNDPEHVDVYHFTSVAPPDTGTRKFVK